MTKQIKRVSKYLKSMKYFCKHSILSSEKSQPLTCCLIVGNSRRRASFPPRLFMKDRVMPWVLARLDMAAVM